MTTIVVARKGGQVAVGGDSLTTFGDTRLANHHKRVHDKILRIGNTRIALCGSSAHYVVMENLLPKAEHRDFSSRAGIYETFRRLHTMLKDHAFLNTKEEDGDPYESSQITALIANPTGIYGVYSYREVFEFDRFWAAGSGRNFALGAMHAVYASARSAEAVVRAGLAAGAEFDKSSAGPFELHTITLGATAKRAKTVKRVRR